MRIFILFLFLLPLGALAGKGGGHGAGNGGDQGYLISIFPWFLQDRTIQVCFEALPSLKLGEKELEESIGSAMAQWVRYLTDPGRQRMHFAPYATRYKIAAGCAKPHDLAVYFGTNSPEITAARSQQNDPLFLVQRRKGSGWTPGFIWLSDRSEWRNPDYRHAALLHALGHVFGIDHVPGTIMDEEIESWIFSATPSRLRAIDYTQEVVHCVSCPLKYPGHSGEAGGAAIAERSAKLQDPAYRSYRPNRARWKVTSGGRTFEFEALDVELRPMEQTSQTENAASGHATADFWNNHFARSRQIALGTLEIGGRTRPVMVSQNTGGFAVNIAYLDATGTARNIFTLHNYANDPILSSACPASQHSPWFRKPVMSFCVETDAVTGLTARDGARLVGRAAAIWKSFLTGKGLPAPDFRFAGACRRAGADLKVLFGGEKSEVRRHLSLYERPLGFARDGTVWISPAALPKERVPVLLHELGHVLGLNHLPGTIMDPTYAPFWSRLSPDPKAASQSIEFFRELSPGKTNQRLDSDTEANGLYPDWSQGPDGTTSHLSLTEKDHSRSIWSLGFHASDPVTPVHSLDLRLSPVTLASDSHLPGRILLGERDSKPVILLENIGSSPVMLFHLDQAPYGRVVRALYSGRRP